MLNYSSLIDLYNSSGVSARTNSSSTKAIGPTAQSPQYPKQGSTSTFISSFLNLSTIPSPEFGSYKNKKQLNVLT